MRGEPTPAVSRRCSRRSRGRTEQRLHDRHHLCPGLLLRSELTAPSRGDRVIARLALALCRAPRRANEGALLEAHKSRIERAHVRQQRAARSLLESGGDRISMHWPHCREGLQDHKIESSAEKLRPVWFFIWHTNGDNATPLLSQMERRRSFLMATKGTPNTDPVQDVCVL